MRKEGSQEGGHQETKKEEAAADPGLGEEGQKEASKAVLWWLSASSMLRFPSQWDGRQAVEEVKAGCLDGRRRGTGLVTHTEIGLH